MNFDLLTLGSGGAAGKIFATMMLHSSGSGEWGRGSAGKIYATMLLHSWFSLI